MSITGKRIIQSAFEALALAKGEARSDEYGIQFSSIAAQMNNLNEEEKEILESYERGEWETVDKLEEEKERLTSYFQDNHSKNNRKSRETQRKRKRTGLKT